MKPFNLEEAKAGRPVVTRDNKPVEIFIFDLNHETYKIGGVLDKREVETWTNDGSFKIDTESSLDLFMKLEKKEGWINVYGGDYYRAGTIFSTKEEAKELSNRANYITTLKVKWEE